MSETSPFNPKNVDQFVVESLKITEWIYKTKIESLQPLQLQEALLNLAACKLMIGQAVASYQYDINFMEAEKDHAWTAKFFEAKKLVDEETNKRMTDGGAKAEADKAVEQTELEIIETKGKLDQLKNLRNDLSDIVTTVQTRIGMLKEELKESKAMP